MQRSMIGQKSPKYFGLEYLLAFLSIILLSYLH